MRCILCGSQDLKVYPAKVAPFFQNRIKHIDLSSPQMVHCKHCDFVYFVPRLSDYDLSFLYNKYRSNEYVAERTRFEPWYKNPVNQRERRIAYNKIFEGLTGIRSVLDYGGYQGDTIPPIFSNAEKFVYEPQEVDTIPGVSRLTDQRTFDFIMCCHVLEHVPYPDQVLEKILAYCHKGTQLYFEVPYDSPFGKNPISGFIRELVFDNPVLLGNYNLLFGRDYTDPRLCMHEHINHFSPRSLWHLLHENGLLSNPKVVTVAGIKCSSCFTRFK